MKINYKQIYKDNNGSLLKIRGVFLKDTKLKDISKKNRRNKFKETLI